MENKLFQPKSNGGSSLQLQINTSAVMLVQLQDMCPSLASLPNNKAFSKPLRCKKYYIFACCQNTVLYSWHLGNRYINSRPILKFWGHVPTPQAMLKSI